MPTSSDNPARVNLQLEQAIHAVLSDRPIAYHASLARALGSVTAGVLLSQFLYWQPRSRDPDGWFWKTQVEIADETALSRTETETARKVLVRAGVIEEKRRGVPAKMHFRVNLTKVVELLARMQEHREGTPPAESVTVSPSSGGHADPQFAGFLQTRLRESVHLDRGVPANQSAGNRQTNTETTTEISPETTTETTISNTFELDMHKQNEIDSSFSRNEILQNLENRLETNRATSQPLAPDHHHGLTAVSDVVKTRRKKTSQRLPERSGEAATASTGSRANSSEMSPPGQPRTGGRRGMADQASAAMKATMDQISAELHDNAARSTLGRVVRLWQQSQQPESAFISAIYAARKIAKQRGDIEKRASGEAGDYGFRNRVPYFLAVLEDQLGLKQGNNSTG